MTNTHNIRISVYFSFSQSLTVRPLCVHFTIFGSLYKVSLKNRIIPPETQKSLKHANIINKNPPSSNRHHAENWIFSLHINLAKVDQRRFTWTIYQIYASCEILERKYTFSRVFGFWISLWLVGLHTFVEYFLEKIKSGRIKSVMNIFPILADDVQSALISLF